MTQRTVPLSRLALAWAVLLGGLVGFWCVRPYCPALVWVIGQGVVLYVSSKIATLICLPPDERRRLSWDGLAAYLVWPGMQPRHFLPERKPDDAEVVPTVRGAVLNVLAGPIFIYLIPYLMPDDWPMKLRLASAAVGYLWLLLFGIFDCLALLFRGAGYGVEKLWHNPAASTSLMEFWGQRWNRIFSGMFREVLFLPLARRIGAGAAMLAVFVYSGLLHENFSFAAQGGYGLPLLYFVIQGAGTWLESWRPVRRLFQRRPWLGWAWTAVVVLGPVRLLFHDPFCDTVLLPTLVDFRVPGLRLPPP
jgi:alginate O-acetyltransferase complex protein AlgI